MISKHFSLKSHFLYVFFLVAILVPFLRPLYNSSFYVSHDGEPHIARIAATYKTLLDKQIPPRWAGDLNFGYGTPSPSFFFPLKGYLGSLLHLFGFSFQGIFKILIGASFILSALFFYAWTSQIFNKKVAFFGALLYGLAPYHFIDLYVRGQLGEMLAFTFIPLTLFFIEKNSKDPIFKNIIFGSISYGLLILSHNILSLMFSIIFAFYMLFRSWGSKKLFLANGSILGLGLLLSMFFWFPALYDSRYINNRVFVGDLYNDHFLQIKKLIFYQWGFGDDISKPNGLTPYIGLIHFLLLISIFPMFRKLNRTIFFWFLIFLGSIFFATSLSEFIWNKVHILQQFQFPWRFMAVGSFAVSVVGTYAMSLLKKSFFTFFTLGLLVVSIPLVRVAGYINKSDNYYLNYPYTAAYHGEATTIWVQGDAYKYPNKKIEIIDGDGEIVDYKRKSNLHTFLAISKKKLKILDNTVYFPGWKAYVDGKKVPIEFQDMNHRGLITFDVPKGKHNVKVIFGETPIRLASDFISLFSLVGIFLIFIFRKKINFIK